MKWIPLRSYNVPLIDRQADRAIEDFNKLRESIFQGDILAVEKMSELQSSVTLILSQIKKRISDLEQFYNRHCHDERVRYLHGCKMKLIRLVSMGPVTEY